MIIIKSNNLSSLLFNKKTLILRRALSISLKPNQINTNDNLNKQNNKSQRFDDENYKNAFRSNNSNRPNVTQSRSNNELKNLITQTTSSMIFNKYEEEIAFRRAQANRSIFLTGNSIHNELEKLIDDILMHGSKIKDVFLFGQKHPTTSGKTNLLIEFETDECVSNLIKKHTTQFINAEKVPVSTRIVYYISSQIPKQKFYAKILIERILSYNVHDFTSENEQKKDSANFFDPNTYKIRNRLRDLYNKSCDEQIQQLYNQFKIDELSTRLRFFVASMIEETFKNLFRDSICVPFGSSSNNFGQKYSDIDLLFALDKHAIKSMDLLHVLEEKEKNFNQRDQISRFRFSTKKREENERKNAQIHLDLIEFIFANYLPRFTTQNLIKRKIFELNFFFYSESYHREFLYFVCNFEF
jgi:hypothetical protein